MRQGGPWESFKREKKQREEKRGRKLRQSKCEAFDTPVGSLGRGIAKKREVKALEEKH